MLDDFHRKVLKFIRVATDIVLKSRRLIGELLLLALGIIGAWHAIHAALLH